MRRGLRSARSPLRKKRAGGEECSAAHGLLAATPSPTPSIPSAWRRRKSFDGPPVVGPNDHIVQSRQGERAGSPEYFARSGPSSEPAAAADVLGDLGGEWHCFPA